MGNNNSLLPMFYYRNYENRLTKEEEQNFSGYIYFGSCSVIISTFRL